jgi:hypothetical protein
MTLRSDAVTITRSSFGLTLAEGKKVPRWECDWLDLAKIDRIWKVSLYERWEGDRKRDMEGWRYLRKDNPYSIPS